MPSPSKTYLALLLTLLTATTLHAKTHNNVTPTPVPDRTDDCTPWDYEDDYAVPPLDGCIPGEDADHITPSPYPSESCTPWDYEDDYAVPPLDGCVPDDYPHYTTITAAQTATGAAAEVSETKLPPKDIFPLPWKGKWKHIKDPKVKRAETTPVDHSKMDHSMNSTEHAGMNKTDEAKKDEAKKDGKSSDAGRFGVVGWGVMGLAGLVVVGLL
ncbi:hypothetical protein BJ508DRAFT_303016 [Ascobolus immersus RN42]|uniref:Uncharacterized protein n=1 Tax=Ascobolus immersus RN42 TaxID=1160509 RepID=A0A3N4IMC6_ASCIM|nr:hypothetical protein BJ508DRAFT_303016 [Ascobolus immersus RN42]